ncbi:DUF6292 family protein [Actinokineospora pegani]|uniref:DUF6292 family protein n=1 Tax=Actinokineospora pegani TaxID=2654637 RepID=UPI0012EA365D|nr:DUF6292 family protein [Actinokineospora pegani]
MTLLADPIADPIVEPAHLVVDHIAVWRYARAVAEAVGVGVESVMVDQDSPVSVYIALDVRGPAHPDRPLALVWDEDQGWSVAQEAGTDLTRVARLSADTPRPAPGAVAEFLDSVTEGFLS